MAVPTLVDLAQISKNPLDTGVMELFLMYSDMLRVIPWKTVGDMRVNSVRLASLPDVGFRALNGGYTVGAIAHFEQMEETMGIVGGDVDIEIEFENNSTQIVSMETAQVDAKMQALSYFINNQLVNGDKASDPLGVDGIKVRVGNLGSRQRINLEVATDTLKVFASSANMHTFIDGLEQAMFVLDQGQCDFFLADETTIRAIYQIARRLTYIATDVMKLTVSGEELWTPTLKLGNRTIPMIQMGFTDETQATKIIPTNETASDAGTDSTHIYLGRWDKGTGKYFSGIQKHALRTKKFDELQEKPTKRIRIDWPFGFVCWSPRALSALYGFKMAAS